MARVFTPGEVYGGLVPTPGDVLATKHLQSILGNTSSHYSLQPPEKLSLISLDAFTHLAVNYIRNNKFNLLLFPLADNELSTIIVYLIFEGYLKTVMEQKVILEHALMHRSTPSKEKFYEC